MAYNIFEGYIQDSWKAINRLTVDGGLRLSHLGGWYERNGVGMAVFDPALYDSQAPGTTFRGLTWTDINSERADLRRRGAERASCAPRVGFAYDLSGNGATLLRGGYGMFNFHDAQGPYSGFIDLPYGVTFTNVTNSPRLARRPERQPEHAAEHQRRHPGDRRQAAAHPELELHGAAPAARTRWSIEAGYVGSKSDRLLNDGINNLNIVPLGAMLNDPTGDPNNYRPYREYGDLPVSQHTHYQNYNALQMLLSRSSSKFSYTASYTWSKALGIRGGGQGATTQPAGDIRDSAYGVLGYDRAHVLNIGYSYLLPDLDDSAALKTALLGGWQFTGVSTYISGAPLQPLASTGVNFGIAGTTPAAPTWAAAPSITGLAATSR